MSKAVLSEDVKASFADLRKVADELGQRGLIDLADEIRLALDVLKHAWALL